MSTKLKLSKQSSSLLEHLSIKLGLRRNVVCRLAIGKSLSVRTSLALFELRDNLGYEFNRYTLTGDMDNVFKALIIQHEGKKISDNQYFSNYLRKHIERGVSLLNSDYSKVNSPIEFLVGLATKKRQTKKK